MLLDEPTTFLDLAHQIELLDLCATSTPAGDDGRGAARPQPGRPYADHLVVMKAVRVVQGDPREVMTADWSRTSSRWACVVVPCPVTGAPAGACAADTGGNSTPPAACG